MNTKADVEKLLDAHDIAGNAFIEIEEAVGRMSVQTGDGASLSKAERLYVKQLHQKALTGIEKGREALDTLSQPIEAMEASHPKPEKNQVMRKVIIDRIKDSGWLDWAFERGDDNARSFADYPSWLASLGNEHLLDAHNRVRDTESSLLRIPLTRCVRTKPK